MPHVTFDSLAAALLFVAAVFGALNPAWSAGTPTHEIRDFAGIATGGHVNGTGSVARFTSPNGVVLDDDGNAIVLDYIALRRVTREGVVTTFAGSLEESGLVDGPAETARFTSLTALARGPDGNYYVADNGTVIRRITPNGDVTTLAGSPTSAGYADGTGSDARFNIPYGLAVAATGEIYVADTFNNVIRRITPEGVVTTLAGMPGSSLVQDGVGSTAGFALPAALAIDQAGNLLVGSFSGLLSGIRGAAPNGAVWTPWFRDDVLALTYGGTGNLYFTDEYGVLRATPAGPPPPWTWDETRIAGDPGQTGWADGLGPDALFNRPAALAVDDDGDFFVCDTDNDVVRLVTADGAVTTLAGRAPGLVDGPAASAQFFRPRMVAADGNGGVYVVDQKNRTIRKISPTGEVSTLADGFESIRDIAADPGGNIFVFDHNVLWRVTPDGSVSALAGSPGKSGSEDGTGEDARFSHDAGIGLDGDGNIFVADSANYTIRRVTPGGVVSTYAGIVGQPGRVDGPLDSAGFYYPVDVAVDSVGNLYVFDERRVRRITTDGNVETVAGGAETEVDGEGEAAGFGNAECIAVDREDNVLIPNERTVRRMTPEGTVTTLASYPMGGLFGAAVGMDNTIYSVDERRHTVLEIVELPLRFVSSPQSTAVTAYSKVSFSVAAAGPNAFSYQWQRSFDGGVTWADLQDDLSFSGTQTAQLQIKGTTHAFDGHQFRAVISDGASSSVSSAALLSISPNPKGDSRLLNLSTRGVAQSGDNVLIPGFVVTGTQSKRLLIRAVGPTLRLHPFNLVRPTAPDPRLTLKRLDTSKNPAVWIDVAASDDWIDQENAAEIVATGADLFAFGLKDDREAALLLDLQPGQYTVVAGDKNNQRGIAVVELYDADPDDLEDAARLVNISNRGFCGVGDEVMIPGFWVSSEGPKTFLIRVVGPRLAQAPFNVKGTMPDPKLTVFSGQKVILTNDNWGDVVDAAYTAQVARDVYAFQLVPNSKDAAVVVTLPPGGYTVVGSSAVEGQTGIVLVEVYAVP